MKTNPKNCYFSILQRESHFLGRQQLHVLLFYVIAIIMSISANLMGWSGPQVAINLIGNALFLLTGIGIFAAYFRQRLSLALALSTIIFITQLTTTAEMIYYALHPDDYSIMLIIVNTVLLSINTIFSLLTYYRYYPLVLGIESIAVYVACTFISGNPHMMNFLVIYLIIFIAIGYLGKQLVQNMQLLNNENTSMKANEKVFFELLGLDDEQAKAYIELAQCKNGNERTGLLMNMLNEELRHNILTNVHEHYAEEKRKKLKFEQIFPELTESERQVCQLIIQDKKLSEICSILNKKESNINSTRAHIRKKLGMLPTQNLHQVLIEKIHERQQDA